MKINKGLVRRVCMGLCLGAALLWPQTMASEVFAAAELPQRLEAGAIGLPTTGCELTSVTEKRTKKGIQYTEVLASIHPMDASAPDIHIEVNLPNDWNGRMVQFGGGGFNGTLVTADGAAAGADAAEPTLLEQGYATYGGDSGHTGAIWDASFAANKEALHNFAHESLKKTHDAARTFIAAFYQRQPAYSYFIGGSNGGREALQAAQRYGRDYDGIVAFYPVLNWIPKGVIDNRNANVLLEDQGAGWLSAADFQLIRQTYLDAADELDGLKDGLVRNYAAAQAKTPEVLAVLDTKLSPAKMKVLRTFLAPQDFEYSFANGLYQMPGYALGEDLRDSMLNQFGTMPGKRDGEMALSSNGSMGWQSFGRSDVDMEHFDYRQYREALQESSCWLDATNLDLNAFKSHGGKLILLHGTNDQLVTVKGSIQYYEGLQKRFGQQELDRFVRFYLVPGYGHGMGDNFTMGRNMIADIDRWVTQGQAPEDIAVVDQNKASHGRMQVLMPYPYYAQYKGGDPQKAESFQRAKQEGI